MSSTVYYDDLIRDYLLFRGFTATLKAFEAELKADKDKGFRMSDESSILVEEQSDWVEGSVGLFHEESNKETAFFDHSDIVMLGEEEANEGEELETRSDHSETANSLSSEAEEESSDSEESVMVDELDYSTYPADYGDLDEDGENGDDDKAVIDTVNDEILRVVLSESQQIQEMLRNFASSINARLEALENSFLEIRGDLKRSLEAQGRRRTTADKNPPEPGAAGPDPISQKPNPDSQLPNAISPKPDPLAQGSDIALQEPDPSPQKAVSASQNPNPAEPHPDFVLQKPDPSLPLPTTSHVQRDPRLAKPRSAISVDLSQPPDAATEPAVKDDPVDPGLTTDVEMTSIEKPKATQTMPPTVTAADKAVRSAKQAASTGKTLPPASDKATTVQKATTKTDDNPLNDKKAPVAPKTGKQAAADGKRPAEGKNSKLAINLPQAAKRSAEETPEGQAGAPPQAVKRSAETVSTVPSQVEKLDMLAPQPGGSGVVTLAKKPAPAPPKPVFTSRQPANLKSAAGTGPTRENASFAQVFHQLLHMQRVQLQNASRSAMGPGAKLLPVPRYIPAWFARACQAQAQPAGQQQGIQPGNQQLVSLQAQLAALQAQFKNGQAQGLLPAPARQDLMTGRQLQGPPPAPARQGQMAGRQPQPFGLMGPRPQVPTDNPTGYSRMLVRPPAMVPNRFSGLHRYRPF